MAQPVTEYATGRTAASFDIPVGEYEHFKGGRYLILGVAEDSRDRTPLVVYIRLYAAAGIAMAARPFTEFFEDVVTPEGLRPRFRYLGAAERSS